jgi:single-strand DNA-binding protein
MAKKGVNCATLVGTLGSPPELRKLGNGNPTASCSVATSYSWTDTQTGAKTEKTDWHRVVLFGKIAELFAQFADKGSVVYFRGRMQTREYEKDGIKRYITEVIVDKDGEMQVISGYKKREQDGGSHSPQAPRQAPSSVPRQLPNASPQAQRPQAPAPTGVMPDYPDFDSYGDDIPFRAVHWLSMI